MAEQKGKKRNQCAKEGCTVAPYKGKPFCHSHIFLLGMKERVQNSYNKYGTPNGSISDNGELSFHSNQINERDSMSRTISDSTGLSRRSSRKILELSEDFSGGKDFSDPANVARSRKTNRDFLELMRRKNFQPQNLRTVTAEGLQRRDWNGNVYYNKDEKREVIAFSENERDYILDPTISMLCLMPRKAKEVDDAYESGKTPYGDYPWVGGFDEYMESSCYCMWDNIEDSSKN